jgi:hypothetical protein
MSNDTPYGNKREKLWNRVFEEYRSQYVNYRKYYLASDVLGKRGQYLNYLTTVISSLLLAVVGAASTITSTPNWFNGLALILAAFTAALSIMVSFGRWQLKSNQYYNSGQQHQNLFKEIEFFVEIEMPDDDKDIEYLEKKTKELIEKKNTLNEATPQLHTKWFNKLKKQRDINWDQPSLEEMKDGGYEFH